MGEAFTLNELTIMEIMAKGEGVKAKNENRWMRALAREGKQAEQVEKRTWKNDDLWRNCWRAA
jgi:hypothetical protein